jgi:hypothetical protein
MTTTTENDLTIVRHTPDRMTSVYRGTAYVGSALPELRPADYEVIGWTSCGPFKPRAAHATEREAIDRLAKDSTP